MRNGSARFDIEALRAFAVAAVLLFHAGAAGLGGGFVGVDVFFVISGYLIIGTLHREFLASGRVRLLEFWARRARRLLPATAVVVGASSVAAWLLSGTTERRDGLLDLVAASTYSANLRFGLEGSDYWASSALSPALHFWSLGVEEQFYIATPLLISAAALVLKGRGRAFRQRAMELALVVGGIASAWYCVALIASDPVWAYYSTATRAWEFALGGLVAVLAVDRAGRPLSARVGARRVVAVGLWVALAASSVVIDEAWGWPGRWTLWPVAATAALLWLGRGSASVSETVGPRGVARAVAWLGGVSYSAYLWHWPVLWVASEWLRVSSPRELPAIVGAGALLLSLVLAHLTKVGVEDPVRFAPRLVKSARNSLLLGAGATAAGVALAMGAAALPAVTVLPSPGLAMPQTPAPSVREGWLQELIAQTVPVIDPAETGATAVPPLAVLPDDRPELNTRGCHVYLAEPEPSKKRCVLGDPDGERRIMLFGDSHAASFFSGLNLAAEALGYQLLPRTRDQCTVADVRTLQGKANRSYFECDQYRRSVIDEAKRIRPDLLVVVTLQPFNILDAQGRVVEDEAVASEMFRAGLRRSLAELAGAGVPVLLVRDLPYYPYNVPDCIATYGAGLCAQRTSDITPPLANDVRVARSIPGVRAIDLTNAICRPDYCYPVRGGAFTVNDAVHLTTAFSRQLAGLWQGVLRHELGQYP